MTEVVKDDNDNDNDPLVRMKMFVITLVRMRTESPPMEAPRMVLTMAKATTPPSAPVDLKVDYWHWENKFLTNEYLQHIWANDPLGTNDPLHFCDE